MSLRQGIGRYVALIVALGAVVLFATACGASADSTALGPRGCDQTVLGTPGKIRPESSGLSCAAIKKLLSSVPAEPGGFLLSGESPDVVWKCNLYSARSADLVSCQRGLRKFRIVRAK